jgi:predicted nucleic acid-binding protein
LILVVDANILVGLLLRMVGRALVTDPRLHLHMAEVIWRETEHNLGRRVAAMVRQGRLDLQDADPLLAESLRIGREYVEIAQAASYARDEVVARRRMPHDLTDWPTIAVALGLGAAIWTEDRHFHGCGIACWTTETLARELAALPAT